MAAVNLITKELTAEAAAVTAASSNLVAITFTIPVDEAKIAEANKTLMEARLAWATKASALFAQAQASTNKLSDRAIAVLVASAPGGRGGPPMGPGGRGGRGGRGGPGGSQDAGKVFTRPSDSPGLGKTVEMPAPDADGFISMFNGKDLAGWDALPGFWSVKEGVIDCVETSEPEGNVQSDLIWIDSRERPEKYANFELKAKFRWLSHTGNSGIQFRSKLNNKATKHVGGYQADMDPANAYTGALYDESGEAGRRENGVGGPHMGPRAHKVVYGSDGGAAKAEPLAENEQALLALLKPVGGDFNDMDVIADGPHITIRVNGHLFCEMVDENPKALKNGIIAFQQHAGQQMEVQFKDPRIKFLP